MRRLLEEERQKRKGLAAERTAAWNEVKMLRKGLEDLLLALGNQEPTGPIFVRLGIWLPVSDQLPGCKPRKGCPGEKGECVYSYSVMHGCEGCDFETYTYFCRKPRQKESSNA